MGTYLFQLVFSNKAVFQMLSFNPGQYSLLSIVLQGKVNMHRIRDKLSLPKFTKRVTGQIDLFQDILLVVSFNLKELVISCFIENLTFLNFLSKQTQTMKAGILDCVLLLCWKLLFVLILFLTTQQKVLKQVKAITAEKTGKEIPL